MPQVTIQRLAPNVDPDIVEQEVAQSLLDAEGLDLAPEQIWVSILEERSDRSGPWWENPLIRVDYAVNELRTPAILQAATKAACKAVGVCYERANVSLQHVRGRIGRFQGNGKDTEYVKFTPGEPE